MYQVEAVAETPVTPETPQFPQVYPRLVKLHGGLAVRGAATVVYITAVFREGGSTLRSMHPEGSVTPEYLVTLVALQAPFAKLIPVGMLEPAALQRLRACAG